VGGTIQIRSGSATGTLLGSVAVPVTGGWETFQTVATPLSATASGPLFLVYTGGAGSLFDVDNFTLAKSGAGAIRGLAGKCLDVNNAGTADGTKVQLYTCNATAAQQWTVTPGTTIKALGKCLDVAGGALVDGTKVQLWTCNGTGAQTWVAQADGTIRNPQSGKCLDVAGNNSADATQIDILTCSAAGNQKWILP
jgi:hypothetical protein